MPRNHIVVVCIIAGFILGFQAAIAGYLVSNNHYNMSMAPITAAALAVAIITICLLNLASTLPGERRDQIPHR